MRWIAGPRQMRAMICRGADRRREQGWGGHSLGVPPMLSAPSPKVGVIAALIYTSIIGIGMAVMHHALGTAYGQAEMVRTLWVFELLGTGFLLWVARRCGGLKAHGFGAINWSQMIWFVPYFVILAWIGALLLPELLMGDLTSGHWKMIGLIALTTCLVGLSEELGFRGLLLRGMLAGYRLPKAMFISAVGFSLLHAVNFFGGLLPGALAGQLFLTFLLGLVMAPLAVQIGSLWPLIIWHALWDFLLITGSYLHVSYTVNIGGEVVPLVTLNLIITMVLSVVLWWRTLRT